jgi:4-aminobutyrate aminotransferase-like enzyme
VGETGEIARKFADPVRASSGLVDASAGFVNEAAAIVDDSGEIFAKAVKIVETSG